MYHYAFNLCDFSVLEKCIHGEKVLMCVYFICKCKHVCFCVCESIHQSVSVYVNLR